MANIFKEAKKVQRLHPRLTWQQAIKAASKKHKKVRPAKKKKKSYRQTGTSKTSVDKTIKAKRPGKRIPASGKAYYERRRNRSDKPFSLTGIKSVIKQKLGKALLDYELASTVGATKKARKEVVKNRKLFKSL